MYDTLKIIYRKDTTAQKCFLLQEFYNYKYDKTKDMMSNISHIRNIAYKLNQLNQQVDDIMIVTKITNILPAQYKHFSSAWDSTTETDRTLENLASRLMQEEEKLKQENKEENIVAFKTIKKIKGNNQIKCFNCKEIGHKQNNCPRKKGCTICKKINHVEKDCFFRNKEVKQCTIGKKINHIEQDCYYKDKSKSKTGNKDKIAFFTEISSQSKEAYLSQIKNNKDRNVEFVVDSASTYHMTNDKSLLNNLKECKEYVKVVKKGESMITSGVGNVKFNKCDLLNVSLVPDLCRNLLSVNAITENGGQVLFSKRKVKVIKDNIEVLKGEKAENGLYIINLRKENVALVTEKESESMNWHKKLGHINFNYLKKIPRIYQKIYVRLINI